MIREVIRLSQGKPPVPDPPQVSPLEAVQPEYEGLAVAVEGGGQEVGDGPGRSRSKEGGGSDDKPQQLLLDAAQLFNEGPADAAEGGGHSSWTQKDYLLYYGETFIALEQEQVKDCQAVGTGQPKFASTDLRCRDGERLGEDDVEQDKRSALVLIRDFN